MSLIKSIAGIRGTIGGVPGEALTPLDVVRFTSAYASLIRSRYKGEGKVKIVVGRDARISGEMVEQLVCGTLTACGADVVSCGLATTPTVEMAVKFAGAQGGIICTASHNPVEWNALKLLNEEGEFINAAEGQELIKFIAEERYEYVPVFELGKISRESFDNRHIEAVLSHPLVDPENIYRRGFKVVLDAVNSVGGIVVPKLLETLGVQCIQINCEPNGHFAHNPEPLPKNLTELSAKVIEEGAHLGISVDPDVDRLVLICENGEPFGEEYTLVSVADYVLNSRKGAAVSNMSSSRALRDVAEAHGCEYYSSAVGEVNVVAVMKDKGAVIGGEGNGGVILPDLHYGRDSLIGIALFLSLLADKGCAASDLRREYPDYYMSKNKIELSAGIDVDKILEEIRSEYAGYPVSDIDGVKVSFEEKRSWIHLRKSNTEPIIRIFSEAPAQEEADKLAQSVLDKLKKIAGS
jgi:phosphomannomutase